MALTAKYRIYGLQSGDRHITLEGTDIHPIKSVRSSR